MANSKKTVAPRSRINRTGTQAPRAARKRTRLPEETAAELTSVAPVVEPAPGPEPPQEVVVETPRAAVPWTPPVDARVRDRSPWLGVDRVGLVRSAVSLLGRALGRRYPLLGRVGGWIGRLSRSS